MRRYLLKRVILFFPTLLGLLTFVFLLGRALPEIPWTSCWGRTPHPKPGPPSAKPCAWTNPCWTSTEVIWATWRWDASESPCERVGPYGASWRRLFLGREKMGLAALVLACCAALPMGLAAAQRPGGRMDRTVRTLRPRACPCPPFFLGPLLLLAFAVLWPLLPVSGADEPGSLILPAVTLAVPLAAVMTRVLRASL